MFNSIAHQVEEKCHAMADSFLVVILQGQLVKLVFTQSRANTYQVGNKIRELFDGLHLLLKEISLNEVHHLPKK